MFRAPRYARLVHQTVTIVNGGPHVGRDQFSRTDKVCEPVALNSQRQVQLICELDGCRETYSIYVFTAKERLLTALRRMLVISVVLAACSFIAQSGKWVYDAGDKSQLLRVVGDVLTGGGVVINFLFLLWLLMSIWFWPPRYKLDFVAFSDKPLPRAWKPDAHATHTVRLRA